MEAQDTPATIVNNTTNPKNGTPGSDNQQQPTPTAYYHDNSGQPPYYQPHTEPTVYYPGQNNGMNSNTVVVTQPVPRYTQEVKVQDNMNLACFAGLFCFMPLGIFAVLKANKSKEAFARGDLESARKYGSDARKFSLIAIGIGIVIIVIIIIVVVVVIVPNIKAAVAAGEATSSNGSRYYHYGYNR